MARPDDPRRRSLRLPTFPYSGPWSYFVTFCTYRRRTILAAPRQGALVLLPAGEIVASEWFQLGQHRPACEPLDHLVMPDHFHGVLRVIDETPGSLWRAISSFKGEVTKAARRLGLVGREPMWARGYYERVVRSDVELSRIRRYIADNPRRWIEKLRAAQGTAPTGIRS